MSTYAAYSLYRATRCLSFTDFSLHVVVRFADPPSAGRPTNAVSPRGRMFTRASIPRGTEGKERNVLEQEDV